VNGPPIPYSTHAYQNSFNAVAGGELYLIDPQCGALARLPAGSKSARPAYDLFGWPCAQVGGAVIVSEGGRRPI
jgi:hypothetical protein